MSLMMSLLIGCQPIYVMVPVTITVPDDTAEADTTQPADTAAADTADGGDTAGDTAAPLEPLEAVFLSSSVWLPPVVREEGSTFRVFLAPSSAQDGRILHFDGAQSTPTETTWSIRGTPATMTAESSSEQSWLLYSNTDSELVLAPVISGTPESGHTVDVGASLTDVALYLDGDTVQAAGCADAHTTILQADSSALLIEEHTSSGRSSCVIEPTNAADTIRVIGCTESIGCQDYALGLDFLDEGILTLNLDSPWEDLTLQQADRHGSQLLGIGGTDQGLFLDGDGDSSSPLGSTALRHFDGHGDVAVGVTTDDRLLLSVDGSTTDLTDALDGRTPQAAAVQDSGGGVLVVALAEDAKGSWLLWGWR